MKYSCPDLLLLESRMHTLPSIIQALRQGGCWLGPGAGAGARPELWYWIRICAEQLGGPARCGGLWFLEQWN